MLILPKAVLIVEDEVITQRYLLNILQEAGVEECICVDNAKDAIEAMKVKRYEMILMDINIKGSVDGIQLSRTLLQHYHLPILFISAYSDDETLDEVLELVPYGFITKPFSSKEILVSIKVAYKHFLTFEEKKKREAENDLIILTKRYSYSTKAHTLYRDGKSVNLNTKQCQMIGILAEKLNHTVSFETLTIDLWGNDEVASSALRTLVYSIRKQLPDLPLHTHSKHGYYLKKQSLL